MVQQGMNAGSKKARRYHWHSAGLASFVDDPHTAVIGNNLGLIMNLSDSGARQNRQGIVEFLSQHPDVQSKEIRRLVLDADHAVRPCHVDAKRLGAVMALALVSEIIYGGKSRFSDPARFAFAHGGKDGHPFPVPLAVYDRSIAT